MDWSAPPWPSTFYSHFSTELHKSCRTFGAPHSWSPGWVNLCWHQDHAPNLIKIHSSKVWDGKTSKSKKSSWQGQIPATPGNLNIPRFQGLSSSINQIPVPGWSQSQHHPHHSKAFSDEKFPSDIPWLLVAIPTELHFYPKECICPWVLLESRMSPLQMTDLGWKSEGGMQMSKGKLEFCLLSRKKPNTHPEKGLNAIFILEKTGK